MRFLQYIRIWVAAVSFALLPMQTVSVQVAGAQEPNAEEAAQPLAEQPHLTQPVEQETHTETQPEEQETYAEESPYTEGSSHLNEGWYVGGSMMGAYRLPFEHGGYNHDHFCYPNDTACYGRSDFPSPEAYRWSYEARSDKFMFPTLTVGYAYDTNVRLELEFGGRWHEENLSSSFVSLHQVLESQPPSDYIRKSGDYTNYYIETSEDYRYIRKNPVQDNEDGVSSNVSTSVGDFRYMSPIVMLNGFVDFDSAASLGSFDVTPNIGVGIGVTPLRLTDISYESNYTDASGALHDPPLSFYNARGTTTVEENTITGQLHFGVDFSKPESHMIVGIRGTVSHSIGTEYKPAFYEKHPMHTSHFGEDFAHFDSIEGVTSWMLGLTLKFQ